MAELLKFCPFGITSRSEQDYQLESSENQNMFYKLEEYIFIHEIKLYIMVTIESKNVCQPFAYSALKNVELVFKEGIT